MEDEIATQFEVSVHAVQVFFLGMYLLFRGSEEISSHRRGSLTSSSPPYSYSDASAPLSPWVPVPVSSLGLQSF